MATEAEKTLEAVKTSIQMEIDGKEFYLKASDASANELGKKLLATLAKEEDSHRLLFESIYKKISAQNDWPAADLHSDGGKELKTVFASATEKLGSQVESSSTELDNVQTALSMENKTHDFYEERAAGAAHPAEKDFYQRLALIEKEHSIVLLDYFEYLKDPAGWFTNKEHPSLDGA